MLSTGLLLADVLVNYVAAFPEIRFAPISTGRTPIVSFIPVQELHPTLLPSDTTQPFTSYSAPETPDSSTLFLEGLVSSEVLPDSLEQVGDTDLEILINDEGQSVTESDVSSTPLGVLSPNEDQKETYLSLRKVQAAINALDVLKGSTSQRSWLRGFIDKMFHSGAPMEQINAPELAISA